MGTCFNFTEPDVTDLLDDIVGRLVSPNNIINYAIYQKELCPTTENEHFQLYFQAEKPVEKVQMLRLLSSDVGDWSLKQPDGTDVDNKKYCSKEESRVEGGASGEHGDRRAIAGKKGQGSRSDLIVMKKDIDGGMDWAELRDLHFGTAARYHHFIKDYIADKKQAALLEQMKTELTGAILRPWQKTLSEILDGPISNRTVHWFWESVGNCGKTWFSKYQAVMNDACVLQSMKKADMQYLISKQLSRVFLFDLCRSNEEGSVNVIYEVAESLKNGFIVSPKYDSKSINFRAPHVVIFANFAPDQSKLSPDRWNIVYIDELDAATN